MHRSLKNLTLRDFPSSDRMGLLEFYKLCIKESLELQGQDPETFYSSERTPEELEYRKKSRACRSASRKNVDKNNIDDDHILEEDEFEEKYNIEEATVTNINLEEYSNEGTYENTSINEKRKHQNESIDDVHPKRKR